jgi:hypothetical protein
MLANPDHIRRRLQIGDLDARALRNELFPLVGKLLTQAEVDNMIREMISYVDAALNIDWSDKSFGDVLESSIEFWNRNGVSFQHGESLPITAIC